MVKVSQYKVAAPLAQLVERQSHHLKVASSILAGSTAVNILFSSVGSTFRVCSDQQRFGVGPHCYEVKSSMTGIAIAIGGAIL